MGVIGRCLRAIWNGPFYIGTLTRPVSLGEVALKLLETLWRGTVMVASLVVGLTLWLATEDNLRREKTLPEQVEATASWGKGCTGEMPLAVELKNRSRQRIGRVDFKISAFEPGRTTDLVSSLDSGFYSDVIILPKGSASGCYGSPEWSDEALGKRPADLRYVVRISNARTTELE